MGPEESGYSEEAGVEGAAFCVSTSALVMEDVKYKGIDVIIKDTIACLYDFITDPFSMFDLTNNPIRQQRIHCVSIGDTMWYTST